MKNYYYLNILILFLYSLNVNAQGTETFESLGENVTTFTNNGYTFTTSPLFDTQLLNAAGAGNSNYFLDNLDNIGTNKTYAITITGGATLFTMKTMEVYVSSSNTGAQPTDDGSMTFTGKVGTTTIFTYTKSSGFPTTLVDPANGYFKLNFAALPGVGDVSSMNIDRLEISHAGAFQYVSVDNFQFGAEVLNTDPPVVNSITLNGTPPTTATSISYTVIFNENSNNVSTDDFIIDAVGTSGNIASVTGSGTTYTVTINNVSGEGTISLDLKASTNIADDLGNSPPPAFTNGTAHTVSRCFIETFEGVSAGSTSFSSNSVNFTTTTNFSIEFLNNAGAADSDHFLSNKNDQGTGKKYSVKTSGGELFTVDDMEMYLSSITDGTTPTNDGSLIVRGKLTGSTLFTITKNSGFPTTHTGADNGFFILDFATSGSSDYSLTNIDELEIELSGAFRYLGLDNFDHCEASSAASPPIVQNIELVGNPQSNVTTVDYQVVFNEVAVNVTTDDFLVTTTGTVTGVINSISGTGNTYTVNINGISGEGTIRLDLKSSTDIADIDGNTPPDPYIAGEVHIVTNCKVETFETLTNDSFSWTTGFIPFTTGTSNFKVRQFDNAGAGGSDRFLDNTTDQGTGKTYTISITNSDIVNMGSMEIYLSSIANGDTPTNDGTLTVKGKLDNVEQFSVTKSTGFPTSLGSTQGFFVWNFSSEGGTDYSSTDIDEIEVTLGSAFQYIVIDNFKYCEFAYDCSNNRLYVDTNATAGNNGSDWTNAYTNLQSALVHTQYCSNINEIWVAKGTYKPGTLETDSFQVPKGITLLGGFNGTETMASERNWATNPTILSGDIDNSNTPNVGDSHSIMTIINDNISVNGFIFENSFADAATALADRSGAAVFISNVTTPSNIQFTNTIFRNNHAVGTGTNGVGGAIISYGNNHSYTNCLFYNNHASSSGGALSPQSGNTLKITNCTFAKNNATTEGGALHFFNVNTEIVNSVFAENTASTRNPDINNHSGSAVSLSYSALDQGSLTPGAGGGTVTIGSNNVDTTTPLFTNAAANDFSLQSTSPLVDAGNNTANNESKGLSTNTRIIDTDSNGTATIDIGAYETLVPPFTELPTGLPDVNDSSVAWGDYDNDGDLDILLTGTIGVPRISEVYKNNGGTFTSINAGLPGVSSSSVAWGDYDNDGDVDILLTGWNGSIIISEVYKNNGDDTFSAINAGLPDVFRSSVAWGDYDNDGDLDILLTGWNGSTGISEVYKNNGDNTFSAINANLPGVFRSSVAWGDYDNDGDLDILLTGDTGSPRISEVYKNNGDNTFTELPTGLPDVNFSSAAWGDYDNDGDLDILLTGFNGSTPISEVYKNNDDNTFSAINANLPGVLGSSVAWGDYDNDGDVDVLLTGWNGSTGISKLYTNTNTIPNTAPTVPTSPTAVVNDKTVTLSWTASTDVQTPNAGLSYNVYIKENPVSLPTYAKSPMAQENNGWRKLPAIGNAQQNTNYTYKLPAKYCGKSTNFTFKVQAIDPSFTGSAFSTEGSFTIDLTAEATHYHVNGAIATSGNGLTWGTAFKTLQEAMNASTSTLCINEIWVAAGTYKPGASPTDSFQVPKGITLLGGFNGTETMASERNWATNPTILSGDIDNSNTPNVGDSHSIMTIINDNISVNGFIFENSFADAATALADRSGAAVFISNVTTPSNIQFINTIFRNNHAVGTGTNGVGGAIISYGNNHSYTNCLFYNNVASSSGGALSPQSGSNLKITNCTFAKNNATTEGGAIHFNNTSADIVNSVFAENTASTRNPDINNRSGSAVSLSYSALDQGSLTPGAGGGTVTIGSNNVDTTTPLFTNAAANDFSLQSTSPLVDAGNNTANNESKGLSTNTRIIDTDSNGTATIDIGAYETLVPPFTELPTGLPGVSSSSVGWGDYDNDGDLDILLTGRVDGSTRISEVYKNSAGTFTAINAGLPGLVGSSVGWGDYDNDGDLDILLTGDTGSTRISEVYKNNGNDTFSAINAGLPGVSSSSVAWGDYDNDGDLDILLTGWNGSTRISEVYKNNGNNTFSAINANLPGVDFSSVAWGDYDNDGDLDVLLTGSTSVSTRISEVYKNNGNDTFSAINAGLSGVSSSSVGWGDYDNDGDLDILLTGTIGGSTRISEVYKNNGNDTFSAINAGLPGVSSSSVGWGDYDNDGDLDILLTGFNGSTRISEVYKNSAGTFISINAGLPAVIGSSVAWGDYDNDGDLDVLLTGSTSVSTRISEVYKNTSTTPNTAPTAPTNPTTVVNDKTVTLSWTASTDVQTPNAGLSYNVYIKENPVGLPIYAKSPMAQENNGWRKLPAIGNARQNTNYTYKLPAKYCGKSTNFTFKVQAIDPSFAGSAFSTEGSFTVDLTAEVTHYHVNGTIATSGNGLTWGTAFKTLQEAMNASTSALCVNEIWVAAGTYKPGDSPTDSFQVPKGITLLGGFNGTETVASERNWATNPTILSGDIDNSNTPNVGDSHSIMTIINDNISVNGFIFENSYADAATALADRSGAAVFISNVTTPSNIQFINTIFRNNHAVGTGTNGVGGAIISYGNNHSYTNCLFYNNVASSSGGALSPQSGSNLKITNCTFAKNNATTEGGAIHFNNTSADIVNSVFAENTASTRNPDINNRSGSAVSLSYSALNQGTLTAGSGSGTVTIGSNNVDTTNPLFTNAAANDFSLQSTSPLVDAGNNTANNESKGLGANTRIINSTIDVGAYEFDPSALSVTDFRITTTIKAYPNPVNGILTLKGTDAAFKYEVFNIQGRRLGGSDSRVSKTIDFSNYPSGLYLIKVLTETGVDMIKVIKE